MNERNEAIANGLQFYVTDRKCKRNHTAMRYASTGQCVECLKEQRLQVAANRKAAQREFANKLSNDMVEARMWIPRKHTAIVTTISNLMCSSMADTLVALITMIDSATLTRNELLCMLTTDANGNITNHAQYPQRNADDGTLLIELSGQWYVASQVAECIRGQRPSVSRLPQ